MSKSLMQQIAQYELTKSQIRIADYVAKNQKRILGMTAKELGKETGVSDATIIRFARTVGFKGYTDMQEQVEKELRNSSEKIGRHSLHDRYVMQFEKYNEDKEIAGDIVRLMGMNLETSIRQNSEDVYKRVCEKILAADHKVVIGLRGGKGPAVQFARLLGTITTEARAVTYDDQDSISSLTDLDENDIAVYLNFPRYYKMDEKIGGIFAERGVPIVLITDSMASPIAKYAGEILLVETEHCGFFHSMIGVEGVLEYLLILMCWQQPEEFRSRLEKRDHVLEEYLIKQ
ncbi:hypothetical protein C0033_13470 [Clostridium sp. chh4-2]|uniref:MurR/RpiR family transcriptional regulator n=1 Tax=Clostridium sp. chh4-2 TaxID=2067550 RepID=UPI000CCDE630|nr:MurR/RpiR family transcriptional regulator [Clostridium sp. chh4-2]PNV61585.1 hypothetical protein C0033_13470 [Clostridium sp. chh4-2]